MIQANPMAKLLLHAHADERLSWEEMVRWSDEFGLRRSELIEIYEAVHAEGKTCRSAFMPAASPSRRVVRRSIALARAYAEGWIGLNRVLSWAEEQELDEDETMALLERCAAEGHGH